jgi:hypothetical protein
MDGANKKIRGLRAPCAGCKLNRLFVAWIANGRASDSKKQGSVKGFGKALIKVSASAMLAGALEMPIGAVHAGLLCRSPGVTDVEPPAAGSPLAAPAFPTS